MHFKFLQALGNKNVGAPPIWLMRQAGRYLPNYQKLRKHNTLMELFHDPEKIVEVTLLPFQYFPLDAAILFSDILMVLEGLSLRYTFVEGSGPHILDSPGSIQKHPAAEVYPHIVQSICTLKKELKVPLIGFVGGPYTVASYIIDQKSTTDQHQTKRLMYQNRAAFETILQEITEATADYMALQIDAGVDAIQIFDSWAGGLAYPEFHRYILPSLQLLTQKAQSRGIPVILFCRGSSFYAPELGTLNPSALSLDWQGDLPTIRKQLPSHIALQGNLDPQLLFGSPEELESATRSLLQQMRGDPGYIFNLGHGVLPETPLENVRRMVDHVRSFC